MCIRDRININDEEEQKKISNAMDELDSAVLTALSTHANDDENNIPVEDNKRAAAAPTTTTTTTTTGSETTMDNDNNDDNDENDSDGISTATMAAVATTVVPECEHVKLTKEVLKWIHRQDSKYRNFFVRRCNQLALSLIHI